jgi:hypothetical protein
MNIQEVPFVLAASAETQDLEIVNYENFKTVHKFVFKSTYGNPHGGIANKGIKTFQRILQSNITRP